MTKKAMKRNEMIVWLIEKGKAPASEEKGEKETECAENMEEVDKENIERQVTEPIEQLGCSQDPFVEDDSTPPPRSDHELSQFSDISSTQEY